MDKVPAKVLVVDDDRSALDIMTRLLEKEGFTAFAADSGPRALEIAATQQVEVILLDVMMPIMDGFQVCAELRAHERTRDIPVILVTAKDDMETRIAGMRLGVSEFLAKPINKHDLFARVRAQLHQRAIEHGVDSFLED
jgi:DNA-binding response OmpR family regulator